MNTIRRARTGDSQLYPPARKRSEAGIMREADHITAVLCKAWISSFPFWVLSKATISHLVTKPALRRRSCQRVWDVEPFADIEFAMANAIIDAGAPFCWDQSLRYRNILE
jgi:hypothetical protein